MNQQNRARVEAIALQDLPAFACDFIHNAEGQEIVPITEQRARSHAKNPDGRADDVALLVAYVGDRCVGYQGLLPVRFEGTGGTSRVFWCTAMYVLPEYRDRMVAVQLVRKVLSLKQDLLLNEFTDAAGKIYAAMQFKELPPLSYVRVRFDRLNLPGLAFWTLMKAGERSAFWRTLGSCGLSVSELVWSGPVKRLLYAILVRRCRGALAGLRCEEVERVRPRAERQDDGRACFLRDADAVNWTLEWPWIREGQPATQPPYYFADVSDLFRNIAVEVHGSEDAYRGFVVLTVVRHRGLTDLKLRDFDLEGEDAAGILIAIVAKYAARHRADVLELPDLLEPLARQHVPSAALFVQSTQRPYLYHPASKGSPLALAHSEIAPDLNDGDTAFF